MELIDGIQTVMDSDNLELQDACQSHLQEVEGMLRKCTLHS